MSGRIIFNGISKNELGYLPQQTEMQKDFPASVYEVVISGCQGRCGLRPFYKREEKNLALEAMKKMNIHNLAGKSYRTWGKNICYAVFRLQKIFIPVRILLYFRVLQLFAFPSE